MSNYCQADQNVLVRFYTLDHPVGVSVVWPVSDWPKLVFSAAGTLTVTSEDQLIVLPPNRALWVPAGSRHEMACRGAASIRTLYFHAEGAPHLPSGPLQVRSLLKELIVETCRIGPLLRTDAHHVCLAHLLRAEIDAAPASTAGVAIPNEELARKAAQLVIEEPARYSTAGTILKTVGCSRRTLERRFQTETGMSLGRWIQQARLVLSLQYLSERPSLLDVALAVGYASASAYAYAFRRHFGIAPIEWSRT